jgi:hypothetical protein
LQKVLSILNLADDNEDSAVSKKKSTKLGPKKITVPGTKKNKRAQKLELTDESEVETFNNSANESKSEEIIEAVTRRPSKQKNYRLSIATEDSFVIEDEDDNSFELSD